MQLARAANVVAFVSVILSACSLTTSFDGLSSGSVGIVGAADAASDRGEMPDALPEDGPLAGPVPSCDVLHRTSPSTADGFQMIDPDGPSGPTAPFRAWCDMTNDGGGWMLVSAALIGEETNVLATVTRDEDAHHGLVMRVFVNSSGCGMAPATRHRFFILDRPAWSRIRLDQTFAGRADCWDIWGGVESNAPVLPNLVPFAPAVDVIRNSIRMGGSNGDAFDGQPLRCDQQTTNFWRTTDGQLRSASVILRREDVALPAGLATGADCGDFAPGTTSPLWWEYRNIYIK